jgi:hypothetical protein
MACRSEDGSLVFLEAVRIWDPPIFIEFRGIAIAVAFVRVLVASEFAVYATFVAVEREAVGTKRQHMANPGNSLRVNVGADRYGLGRGYADGFSAVVDFGGCVVQGDAQLLKGLLELAVPEFTEAIGCWAAPYGVLYLLINSGGEGGNSVGLLIELALEGCHCFEFATEHCS